MKYAIVPESQLKKRKNNEQVQQIRAEERAARQTRNQEKRKLIFKKAEQYVQEYRDMEASQVEQRRLAKSQGNFYIAPESKIAFVVRIRGINRLSPKVRKITHLLRLRQIFNGVFIKVNRATMGMLQLINPYVTYGFPSLRTVRSLVYKRGYGRVANYDRVPLNNEIIEQYLGNLGIVCMEDLVHEIYTCGPNFKQATNFLWPFKLSAPRGGMNKKRIHYNEGGDYGNREEQINPFVARMI